MSSITTRRAQVRHVFTDDEGRNLELSILDLDESQHNRAIKDVRPDIRDQIADLRPGDVIDVSGREILVRKRLTVLATDVRLVA